MGVNGLWNLIEPTGKPVPLESLENKILAVDVSIWLNQAVKGFRDKQGNAVGNSHLLGLFHRICKLMFYRIKPVFVFDGGVPLLKKHTLSSRRQRKSKASKEVENIQQRLLSNIIKSTAINQAMGKNKTGCSPKKPVASTSKERDMFELPPIPEKFKSGNDYSGTTLNSSSDDSESEDAYKRYNNVNLHAVNFEGEEFRSLPVDTQLDILNDLKDTRKQNSWGKIHEMPQHSGDFSGFQMQRLLKRFSLQQRLEEVQKEVGDQNMQEVDFYSGQSVIKASTKRIASDENKQYIMVKGLQGKKAVESLPPAKRLKLDTEFNKSSTSSQPSTSRGFPTSMYKPVLEKDTINPNEDIDNDATFEDVWSEAMTKPIPNKTINKEYNSKPNKESSTECSKALSVAKDFMFVASAFTQEQILSILQSGSPTKSNKISENVGPNLEDKDVTKISSDSDSDFQEVPDIPVDAIFNAVKRNSVENVSESKPDEAGKSLEITVDVSQKIDDDFFSDVFTAVASEQPGIADKNESNNEMECGNLSSDVTLQNDSDDTESKQYSDEHKCKITDTDIFEVDDSDSEISDNEHSVDNVKILTDSKQLTNNEQQCADKQCTNNDDQNTEKQPTDNEDQNTNKQYTDKKEQVVDKTPKATVTEVLMGNREVLQHQSKSVDRSCYNEDDNLSTASGPTLEVLLAEQENLTVENKSLTSERQRQERLAANITEQMQIEAQELLQLFGIPYLIAPMEAEAQCAFLDIGNLTQGTVTDDSDIWLFGGIRVYKNFFNQTRHLEYFQNSDILRNFKLDRMKMILLALLVGSDYTNGIESVGPVTALEILAEFPGEGIESLQAFKTWWEESRKQLYPSPSETKLRRKLRHYVLHEGFPSNTVVDSYMNPVIDESSEPFSWGIPKLNLIREFAREKFGWLHSKTDDILLPVLRKWVSNKKQLSLDSFFKITLKPKSIDEHLSKRVQSAIKRARGEDSDEDPDDPPEKIVKKSVAPRKRTLAKKSVKKQNTSNSNIVGESSVSISAVVRNNNDIDVVPEPATSSGEVIWQKEMDKVKMQVNKLKAIEIFKKKPQHRGKGRGRKVANVKRQVEFKSPNLSESSDSSS